MCHWFESSWSHQIKKYLFYKFNRRKEEKYEGEIRKIVLSILNENQNLVDDYKNGKNVFGYIVGLIMKNTHGKANPVVTSKVLQEELNKK